MAGKFRYFVYGKDEKRKREGGTIHRCGLASSLMTKKTYPLYLFTRITITALLVGGFSATMYSMRGLPRRSVHHWIIDAASSQDWLWKAVHELRAPPESGFGVVGASQI